MLVPHPKTFGYLVGYQNDYETNLTNDLLGAARTLGLEVIVLQCLRDSDIEAAFTLLAQRQVSGVVVSGPGAPTGRRMAMSSETPMGRRYLMIRAREAAAVIDHNWVSPDNQRGLSPESNMPDWLTWPADLLLWIGGVVAGWFFSKDAASFTDVQTAFAALVLAAFVALLVFWRNLFEYCRSLWKTR